MFDGICEVITREMEKLDEKYSSGNIALTDKDLADIDKMAHALKSIETYNAMKGSSEASMYGGSYARGRSRTTGRYVSRDGGSYGYDPYHGEPERLDRRY